MKRLIIFTALCVIALSCCAQTRSKSVVAASPAVRYVGRSATDANGAVRFDWSGTYATFRFTGGRIAMRASDTHRNYFNVFIDGRQTAVISTSQRDSLIVLADGLSRGEHELRLQKRTEGEQGCTTIHSWVIAERGEILPVTAIPTRHIEFIGNSLTCGFGTEAASKDDPFTAETENCDKAFGCIIARLFDADYTLIAHSGRGVVRNYGDSLQVSKNTVTDRMMRTFDECDSINWDFTRSPYKPDVVVINLGSNDYSTRPHPTKEQFTAAYTRLIDQLRSGYGDVPILCVAPSVGDEAFDTIKAFATSYGGLHFAAVLPEFRNESSELGACSHPNYEGQRKMAMTLIPYISTITGWPVEHKVIE